MSEIETVAAEITKPMRGRPKEHPQFEVALEPEDAFPGILSQSQSLSLAHECSQ